MNSHDVLIEPVITEKTTFMRETGNKYVFKVHKSADKRLVKKAFQDVFGIEPTGCQTVNVLGKRRRTRRGYVQRSSWKKAIISVDAGKKLDFFEGL